MKYLLFATLFVSLLITSLFPTMAMAAAPAPATGCTIRARPIELSDPDASYAVGAIITDSNNRWGLICALNAVNIATNWIFIVMVVIAVALVLIGAFNLMTAAGDTAKVKKGRDYIMYAAIGLIVALLARAVPSIVVAVLG